MTFLIFLKTKRWNSRVNGVLFTRRKVTLLSRMRRWDGENSSNRPCKNHSYLPAAYPNSLFFHTCLSFVQPNTKTGRFHQSLVLHSLWRLQGYVKLTIINFYAFPLLIYLHQFNSQLGNKKNEKSKGKILPPLHFPTYLSDLCYAYCIISGTPGEVKSKHLWVSTPLKAISGRCKSWTDLKIYPPT